MARKAAKLWVRYANQSPAGIDQLARRVSALGGVKHAHRNA